MPRKKSENFDFERSLNQLNTLVEQMEKGDLTLEQSMKHFEQGVALIRQCQGALSQAEQKVEILIKEQDQETLQSFKTDEP